MRRLSIVRLAVASTVLLAAVVALPQTRAIAAEGEIPVVSQDAAPEAAPPAATVYPPADAEVLVRDGGVAAGKAALPGSGHFVYFECPQGTWYLVAVDVFAVRTGIQEPAAGDWRLTVCDAKFKTLWTIEKPYALLGRDNEQWYRIPVPPVEPPVNILGKRQSFWLNLAFENSQLKGVSIGQDAPKGSNNSKVGLPDGVPQDTAAKFDWMVRAVVSQTPGVPTEDIGVWHSGLIELAYDDGTSDGMGPVEGMGPAVHFQNVPAHSILEGFSVYGWRAGRNYDPARSQGSYWVVDESGTVIASGSFRYSIFAEEARWTDIEVRKVPVPGSFWFVMNPNADSRKRINIHYDTNLRGRSHAKMGKGPKEYVNTIEKLEWMIRAYVRQRITGVSDTSEAVAPD